MQTINYSILTQFVPETIDLLTKRIRLLQAISAHDVIGRRLLSQQLQLTERVIRSQLEQLKQLDCITLSTQGVRLTNKGKAMLAYFETKVMQPQTLQQLALQLKEQFQLKTCHVVAGDSDIDSSVNHQMGIALTQLLDTILPKGNVILSVSGGTTLANIVQSIDKALAQNRQFTIVPARGGGRGELAIQANTVSHLLAQRLNGEHNALFVPEQISRESLTLLMSDPSISKIINQLQRSNCLIYSVGSATIMAERRGALPHEIDVIHQHHAVGEALGTFFDEKGQVVYRLARLGLGLEDLSSLPCEVLVVSGSNKYKAVSAYMKLASNNTHLVIDEALAKLVLKEVTLET